MRHADVEVAARIQSANAFSCVHGIKLNLSRANTICRRSDSPIGALNEYSMRAET